MGYILGTSTNHILVTLTSVCIGLYTCRVIKCLYFSPLRNVPGPFLARVTGLWGILMAVTGREHKWYVRLHERYGPVVRVAPNHFSFNRLEDVNIIYNGCVDKSAYYDAFGDPQNPSPWSVRDNRQHEMRSRGFAYMYSRAWTENYEKVVDYKIELLRGILAAAARDGGPCSIPNLLKSFAVDVMSRITLGKDSDALRTLSDGTRVVDAIENAFWYSSVLGHLPRLHGWLVQAGRWLGLKPPILGLLNRARGLRPGRSTAWELSDSYLKRLFVMLDEDRTNRQAIEDCCFSNLVFGFAKVSITLSAAIFHIYNRPEVLRKLRQSLEDQTRLGNLSNPATFEEALALPYLQAVVKESFRLHPAIGTLLPRIVPQGGMKLAGYMFPEGTVIGANPWAVNRSMADYGDDAEDFGPERWLQDESTLRDGLFSFGAGSRSCPGLSLCQMIMSKLIVELVREFDIDFSLEEVFLNMRSGWFVWMDYE